MLRLIAMGLVLITVSAAAKDTPKQAKEKMICRRDETVGTRLARRTCMTAAQWNALEGDRRQNLREMADRNERDGFENSPYAKPQ